MPYKKRRDEHAYQRAYRLNLKLEAFEAYGGSVCACCGEEHIEFLTLDHIAGDGAVNKRLIGRHVGSSRLYLWLRAHGWPQGLRVLCWNCNAALAYYGHCPHGNVDVGPGNGVTPDDYSPLQGRLAI